MEQIISVKDDLEFMLQRQQEYHSNKTQELQEAIDLLLNEKSDLIFQLNQQSSDLQSKDEALSKAN